MCREARGTGGGTIREKEDGRKERKEEQKKKKEKEEEEKKEGEEDKASVKKRKVDARIEMQFDPWPGSSSSSAYYGTTNDGAEVGSPRAHLT